MLTKQIGEIIDCIRTKANAQHYTEELRELDLMVTVMGDYDFARQLLNDSKIFNENYYKTEIVGTCSNVQSLKLDLANFLEEVNSQMEGVDSESEQSLNQFREYLTCHIHQHAERVRPLWEAVQKVMNSFSDDIGVTDRFTGFRNNITKPLGKFEYQASSAVAHCERASEHEEQLEGESLGARVFVPYTDEAFAGTSEYMDNYVQLAAVRSKTDFELNPRPDYSKYGRPLMFFTSSKTVSEYRDIFTWPGNGLIEPRIPWI